MRGRLVGGAAGLAALCALTAMLAVPASSEETEAVVATVNGSPITAADMSATAVDLAAALQNYAPAEHGAVVLDFLINQKLMAAAATKDGIQDTPAFAQRMALVRERELRDAYFEKAVSNAVGEEEIKEAYAKVAEQSAKREEVHASHILVETKEAAEAIVKELEGGADFAELAKRKSIGPSGKSGGDLGFVGENDVAQPFFRAAAALEPGKLSEPVQTEFGWHVIKVVGKRPASAPPLEAVRDEIGRFLVRQKFLAIVTELKAAAKIEIVEEPKAEEEAPQADAEEPAPDKTDAQ
jgi:peptidyl-prolyl cis-trans isomerase C